jgi:hypothetical protein
MRECWAACLGDCAGKLSREHIVTEGTFAENEIIVQGFDWCREAPVKIGLANLTSKILCEKHNSSLSAADNAGIEAAKHLDEFFRLANVRQAMKSKRWRVFRLKTNGFELERWFLKTLTNVALGRRDPSDTLAQSDPWLPSRELVEIAFGLKRFDPRAGLYMLTRAGQNIDPNTKFQIMTLYDTPNRLVGARFMMFGFAFVIYLEREGLNGPVRVGGGAGEVDPGALNPVFRPGAISYNTNPAKKHLSHILEIDWSRSA